MTDTTDSRVFDFIGAIHEVKPKYEIYDQDIEFAPQSLRLILTCCKDLLDMLLESEDLFKRYNRPYPAQAVLIKRLNDTVTFIQRHDRGRRSSGGSDADSSNQPIWNDDLNLFEQTRARMLHDTMMMESQKLIQFLLVLSL
jgi:hypothetical protein